jgi:hypothetical protein
MLRQFSQPALELELADVDLKQAVVDRRGAGSANREGAAAVLKPSL